MQSRIYDCPLCANEVEVIDFQSSGPVRCCYCDGQFRTDAISSRVPTFDYVRKSRPPQPPAVIVERPAHLPYCESCRTTVNPNVVSVNESPGGIILPTAVGAVYRANSYTRLVKVCPFCGNQVFSARDIESARQSGNARILIMVIVIISVAVLTFFACIASNG